jgi:DNA-binding transcriptional MerR regulator
MEEIVHKKGKIYYSMGEVAEMFDVKPSLIRFWETKFDIIRPQKNKKGNRMFTVRDVDNLKLIYHLVKEKGMTLAGAEKVLKGDREGTIRDMEIADRLLAIKAMLVEIREELKTEGEAISPEGYLEEESPESPAADSDAAEEPTEDGFVLLAEEVRVEVVTDGSSPWAADEEDVPEDEDGEPVDESQREAAMDELRNIKGILDGWDDIDEAAAEEPYAAEPTDEPAGDDREEDYPNPWEEPEEEPAEPETPGGISVTGDLFGTDLCSTFSEDDREAIEAQEKEETQRPEIYEQTLF